MITFYPGPSKVYPQVGQYLQEAFESGLISANHRSGEFMQMLENTISDLKFKLNVPADYEVYFVSSATECWEIIAQSLMIDSSLHVFTGAFGEKWMEYTHRISHRTSEASFDYNADLILDKSAIFSKNEIICVTHNETSNGTKVPDAFLPELRQKFENLIAVDATSSMAGVVLPWEAADLWYASVQKCFGLPAGMGVMIISPNAVERALQVGEHKHYNSLLFMRENFLKFQTPYTPNTLGIYLLGKVMQQVPPIAEVDSLTRQRAAGWYAFLAEHHYELLVKNDPVRSDTVIAVRDTKERIAELKHFAKAEGITLGNGYGKEKEVSFRIANFPAISQDEIEILQNFLAKMSSR
ncbi:aminotransferase class V-fold PLP-dependent enzyme [Dyadobacter sp. CY323]|uniref:aminotransferase class V-fold PLP-dependent enzyme n=1 Tax=Dyadobacter sp. CY323 TaxID=2907302 RepID=UPI001F34B92B|nr:aminotransferase class V-fold PLP-dependent enzyme [Dyadobacter sp. CY323]MCE6991680.1 aminotransferase class V-fold PLP-dependent enzyme [Dyadobacter sp. CY323]